MSLRKTVLAMGIAVVFVIFIAYGLFAIYEPPKRYYEQSKCWEQHDCEKDVRECQEAKRIAALNASGVNETETGATETGPRQAEPEMARPVPVPGYDECSKGRYGSKEYIDCMEQRDDCEDAFRKTTARYRHARNSFYVLFIIALAAILVGMFLRLESISSGFIAGGILVLVWSLIYTAEYWLQWNKYVKLTALGLVLVILVYLGYKKIESRVAPQVHKRKKR
jgi:hypothetical protein